MDKKKTPAKKKPERKVEKTVPKPKTNPLRKIDFTPAGEKKMPTDFSIVAGTSGSFTATLTPPNGKQAPNTVPQWSSKDPSVVLKPSDDGLKCDAAVPAEFVEPTFDLKVMAQSADSNIGAVIKIHPIKVTHPAGHALKQNADALTDIDFAQTA